MKTEKIEIKINWQGVLPMLIALLENGTPEGRKTAREELLKMAKLADEANELRRT